MIQRYTVEVIFGEVINARRAKQIIAIDLYFGGKSFQLLLNMQFPSGGKRGRKEATTTEVDVKTTANFISRHSRNGIFIE